MYPATLPNSLISSNSFLVSSLGFSMYSTMSSANSDSFTSSFPIWIPFVSFYSVIAMAETSKTMLIIVVRVGNLVLFLILEKMVALFHHWEWCWLWVCHIWPLLYWGKFPLCLLWRLFIINRSEFGWKLFLHLLRSSYGFSPSICYYGLSHWLICVYWRILAFLG